MVDKYSNAAEAALKLNKHKLALHYYGLAYQELLKQPNTKSHQQELMKFKSKIASLKIETTASGANKKVIAPDTASSEWLEYCAEQDAWKKKRLYD